MDTSGGEDHDDNSNNNNSPFMRTNPPGTVLTSFMVPATTLRWGLFLFSLYREENKLRAHNH